MMKRKAKTVILVMVMVVLAAVILLCMKSHKGDIVIATVNGEPVYQSDYDRIRELSTGLTDDEIIELVMKELLVYQEARTLGFVIEDDVVESRMASLKTEMPDLYLLCIEQYGSEEAYKRALSYTILYDMVYAYYSDQYISNLEYNVDDIKREAIECHYASEAEMEVDEEKIIISFLKEKYRDEIKRYFKQWNDDKFEKADKEYKNKE